MAIRFKGGTLKIADVVGNPSSPVKIDLAKYTGLRRVLVRGSRYLDIYGGEVRAQIGDTGPRLAVEPNCSNITLSDISIFGHPDGENYLNFSVSDWRRGTPGASLKGSAIFASDIRITASGGAKGGTGLGFDLRDSNLQRITVMGASRDLFRFHGQNVTLENSGFFDLVATNPNNHPDVGQGWQIKGAPPEHSITIRGCLAVPGLNLAGHPLAAHAQGINAFDGSDRLTIESNFLDCPASNGIVVMGAQAATIEYNMVVRRARRNKNNPDAGFIGPRILVRNGKDGAPSQNCAVVGNIAMCPPAGIDEHGNRVGGNLRRQVTQSDWLAWLASHPDTPNGNYKGPFPDEVPVVEVSDGYDAPDSDTDHVTVPDPDTDPVPAPENSDAQDSATRDWSEIVQDLERLTAEARAKVASGA